MFDHLTGLMMMTRSPNMDYRVASTSEVFVRFQVTPCFGSTTMFGQPCQSVIGRFTDPEGAEGLGGQTVVPGSPESFFPGHGYSFQSRPGEETTDRLAELISKFQRGRPRTLYEEYINPENEQKWWYDLVTGEATISRPSGAVILRDESASVEWKKVLLCYELGKVGYVGFCFFLKRSTAQGSLGSYELTRIT